MLWPSSKLACCDTQDPTSAIRTAKNTTETTTRPIGEVILSPPSGEVRQGATRRHGSGTGSTCSSYRNIRLRRALVSDESHLERSCEYAQSTKITPKVANAATCISLSTVTQSTAVPTLYTRKVWCEWCLNRMKSCNDFLLLMLLYRGRCASALHGQVQLRAQSVSFRVDGALYP